MKNPQEKKLAQKILAGDPRALRIFYKAHKPKLHAYIISRVKTPEDAQELVQDTFLSFLDSLPLFSFRSSLWTFLVSIARHEIADYYRKIYAKRAIKYVPFVDRFYVEPLYEAEETRELFDQTLKQLKPIERQLIEYKYDFKWSVKKIAQAMEITPKAAESRLFRARKNFQLAYNRLANDF